MCIVFISSMPLFCDNLPLQIFIFLNIWSSSLHTGFAGIILAKLTISLLTYFISSLINGSRSLLEHSIMYQMYVSRIMVKTKFLWSLSLKYEQGLCFLTGLLFSLLYALNWCMYLVLVNIIWTGVKYFGLVRVFWIWLIIYFDLGHLSIPWFRSSYSKWPCLRHTLHPYDTSCELHLAKVFPNCVFLSNSLALKSSSCLGNSLVCIFLYPAWISLSHIWLVLSSLVHLSLL